MKLFASILVASVATAIALWFMLYTFWFVLSLILWLHGGEFFGLQVPIVPLWSVRWQWHLTIPVLFLAISATVAYAVWTIRTAGRRLRRN